MPTRSITVNGRTWRVLPSGRVTQYDRDEFSLMFITGTGATRTVRVTRYSPQCARSRAQSLAELTDAGRIAAQLRDLRAMRLTRAERIVTRLNELGVRVTLEDVLGESAGGAVGRPHIARALVNNGWATDLRDAFDRYLGNGRPAFVPKDRLAIGDAITMIHEA